ncbi:LysR substrate-binding domain-containing protein [Pseudomonas oryzihabitans]|uniref:LysR substrate-binding domain-containing protein n=1 Tax=Pseudomonas oryzihabitans TaxID=47885 RepID=UPI0028A97837|nr:LysR substrate-binding domain-containing protein [Pseudomonas oryzihabitans]
MELRHLRYFVAVAEELHFGRAAQRLNLSQPPLSQQIQALESELGTRLLERTNRRVALTEAGRLFLDEARQILLASERAAERVRRAGRGETGQLQVGFSASSPFVATIPKTLFAYRRAYPEVRLQLQEMSSREQIDAMLAGNLQIGLIRPIELPDALVAVELFREPLVVALRHDHPLAQQGSGPLPLAALAEEPFVYFPRSFGTGLYQQLHSLAARAGFTPRIVQEASEVLIILGLVAAGLGVTVLPATYQRTQMEGLVYRELDDPEATSAVWLLRRRDEASPQAEAFVGLLVGIDEQSI